MIQTTMGYVKQAEDVTGHLGTPFGPLPDELVGSGKGGLRECAPHHFPITRDALFSATGGK